MLKPPVLRFADDIPRAQFWFAYDRSLPPIGERHGQKVVSGYAFRVPEEWGYYAAYWRAIDELQMKEPVLAPASPFHIIDWMRGHPSEVKFRKPFPANPE